MADNNKIGKEFKIEMHDDRKEGAVMEDRAGKCIRQPLLKCECGGPIYVRKTYINAEGRIIRLRRCDCCLKEFRGTEVIAAEGGSVK